MKAIPFFRTMACRNSPKLEDGEKINLDAKEEKTSRVWKGDVDVLLVPQLK